VIGGSEDYTGAPYFSALASTLLGADMSHVICEPQAAQVIKTYNPSLMVHPYMRQSQHASSQTTAHAVSGPIIKFLDRLHVIVVGPGLGRDEMMQETARQVVVEAVKRNMPVVLDADGLSLVQKHPDIIRGHHNVVLTPNVVEFKRLWESLKMEGEPDPKQGCAKLAQSLGGVTVVQKGVQDVISNGNQTMICDIDGALKRAGGQGDTLSGSLATFLAWRKAYHEDLWE